MRIEDAFEQVLRAGSSADIAQFLDDLAFELGFAAWTYANTTKLPASEYDPAPYYLTTVPNAFERDYVAEDGLKWDPCAIYALAYRNTFEWTDLPHWHKAAGPSPGRKRRGVRLMEVAFDHNYTNGTVVPSRTLDQDGRPVDTIVTLFQEKRGRGETADPRLLTWLSPLVHAASARLCELSPQVRGRLVATAPLTDRELEVLRWAARGKTEEECGEILGISGRTVGKFVERAMDKLGATNKAHAVALALTRGLIAL